MIGAICGDIIGSVHEGAPPVPRDFPLFVPASRFTDDTVLSIAVACALREGTDFASALRSWGRRYPEAGYGGMFLRWLFGEIAGPYNSYGNGSAMRVSSIGWAFEDLDSVLEEAARSAEVTHNHPEGVKGAQAVAAAVWLGRRGGSRGAIRELFQERFGYDCGASLEELRLRDGFDVTCRGTVPAAAVAFLRSADYEDAVRNAVSFGGDADTLACIAGALAEAFYGAVPESIQSEALKRLDPPLLLELRNCASVFGLPLAPGL